MKTSNMFVAFFTLLGTCLALPAVENSLAARTVPEALCTDTVCISEKHAVYNTTSHECECEWIISPCANILCIAEKQPVENPTTGICECQWIDTSCPDIFCISEQRPVFDTTTGTCSCQWIPGLEPSSISTPEATPTPTLSPKSPTPKPGCAGLFCISEQHPVYNATSGHCECEWIPGLEPSTVKRALPKPTLTKACPGLFCISEQHPVYNATSGHCECEWIPGFGPSESK